MGIYGRGRSTKSLNYHAAICPKFQNSAKNLKVRNFKYFSFKCQKFQNFTDFSEH